MLTPLYILTGLLLSVVSVPLIQRRIRPNPLYGFRTPKTLGSERIWYEANEFCGKKLFIAGIVTIIAAIVLAFIPLSLVANALANAAVMLVSVLWATLVSLAHLQKL